MPSYKDVFENRGALYNRATGLCPDARETERQLLIKGIPLQAGQVVCDAPAGGGYVADALARLGAKVICIEPSEVFAESISAIHDKRLSPLTDFDLEDQAVDHVVSLAGLHHLHDREPFFQEAYRALRAGGHIAVADVSAGSRVDHFLNVTVNEHSETGHQGWFFEEGDFSKLMEEAGFENASEKIEHFTWTFPDEAVMCEYCRCLFGLTKLQVEDLPKILAQELGYKSTETSVELNWSLLYATAQKPHA